MDKSITQKAKRINYYPLMWVLLISSLMALLTFIFRSFVILDYNGQNVTIFAIDILRRNNNILINQPEFALLRYTILTVISLGIVNICMSLWQVGYSNARRMKLINSIRFAITGLVIILLIFITSAASDGNIIINDTLLGALGANCVIYLFAYMFNLYYGLSNKLPIINYKAISVFMILGGCTIFAMSFLNINGIAITGAKSIYLPSFLEMNSQALIEVVGTNRTYAWLSRIFIFIYIYNIIWNILFVLTNKCYRIFNLTKYIYSALFSLYFAHYCINVLGSTVQGSIGILIIASLYIILALYTLLSFKTLKGKVYANINEEMMFDDDDSYYDESSRFINQAPIFNCENSGIVSIKDSTVSNKITRPPRKMDYSMSSQVSSQVSSQDNSIKIVMPQATPQEKPREFNSNCYKNRQERSYLIEDEDYIAIEDEAKITLDNIVLEVKTSDNKDANTQDNSILLVDNMVQQEQIIGYNQVPFGSGRFSKDDFNYSKANDNQDDEFINDFYADDIFITESDYRKLNEPEEILVEEIEDDVLENEESIRIEESNAPSLNSILASLDYEDHEVKELGPQVQYVDNMSLYQSYSNTSKAIYEDNSSDDYIDYSAMRNYRPQHLGFLDKNNAKLKFDNVNIMPEEIKTVINDNFFNTIDYKTKEEFSNLFMNTDNLIISRLPQYVTNGDNTQFFAFVMKYIEVLGASSQLLLSIYDYVSQIYSNDKLFVSGCNKKLIDICYSRATRDSSMLVKAQDLCTKEIKLMLSTDIEATLPVIERLILIHIKDKHYNEALELCNATLRLNISEQSSKIFIRKQSKITSMINKEKAND